MKRFTTLSLLLLLIPILGLSQSFEDGLELYEQQRYNEALEIFSSLDDDQSVLFAGKTHFDLQQYLKANTYLMRVAENAREISYRQEAMFTLGLSYFGMKHYSKSLDQLHELIISEQRGRAKVDAQRFYRQVLRYLTLDQRFDAIQSTKYQTVARDLVESAANTVSSLEYSALLSVLLERTTNANERNILASELTRTSRPGNDASSQTRALSAPDGMVYNVGVILPADEEPDPNMLVPRNLYYGITLAAEDFNSRYPDKKIALNFRNSYRDPDSTAKAFHQAVWQDFSDVVIGPLFSETASRMASLSEQFSVPMVAPLANSDEINLDYNFTFQMNPTFEVHGRRMAQHAVQTLNLDTLAVITPTNALGTASARSFRREAERLGAFVSYYIEEDFSSLGYDLTDFTEVFTTDAELADSLNYIPTEGIYAPFTGQAANTLINLLMTDLEVLDSEMVVMGSEEWENADLSSYQERNFEIYYSESFKETTDTTASNLFFEDYQTRFGFEPDQFSKIGYDIGNYIFGQLAESVNPSLLPNALRTGDPYNGLSLTIDMEGERINQHVTIRALTPMAVERMPQSRVTSPASGQN